MLDELKNIKSSKKDLKNFAWVMGFFLSGMGGCLLWFEKESCRYFLISGIAFLSSGLLVPKILLPLQKIWMGFSVIMGWFMTRVILSVLFYLVLTPIGLLARLFKKQFLDLKIDKLQDSYWNYREAEELESGRYERQF